MKKSVLLIFYVFLISIHLFAQNIYSIEEEIIWKKSTESNSPFVFQNVDYQLNSTPYFNKIYKLDTSVNFKNLTIKLENCQYIAFDAHECSKIIRFTISDTFNINSKIFESTDGAFLQLKFVPFIVKDGKYFKLQKFEIKMNSNTSKVLKDLKGETYAVKSKLADGKWYKVKVQKDGIYRLTNEDIVKMGFSNLNNIKIFGSGGGLLPTYNNISHVDDLVEIPVLSTPTEIQFYAEGADKWNYDGVQNSFRHAMHFFSDVSYYFVTEGVSKNENQIKEAILLTTPSDFSLSQYQDFQFHEINDTNLVESGRNRYGEHFANLLTYSFNFTFPGAVANQPLTFRTSVVNRSINQATTMTLRTGNFSKQFSLPESYSGETASIAEEYTDISTTTSSAGDNINVGLTYQKSTGASEAWLDYIEVFAYRNLSLASENFKIINYFDKNTIGKVVQFNISNAASDCKVLNVTDINNPQLSPLITDGASKYFRILSSSAAKKFIIFNGFSFPKPVMDGVNTGLVSNQNIHGTQTPDYVIVTHTSFLEQANRLAEYHRKRNNLNCLVVTNEQVYNEFSSGSPDVSAIRNLAKMFYDRKDGIFKYLLLFGDGSYNNFKPISQGNTDFVLTFQTENSLDPIGSFTTDDFFALLDDNEGDADGLLDIGVGRFPVQTADQAKSMVDKVIHYQAIESQGDWRNYLSLIADDEDYNLHINQANTLSEFVKSNYESVNMDKIYLDAFLQSSTSNGPRYPDVNKAIKDRMEKGTLIMNYTGHANEDGLSVEHVLWRNEIEEWQNFDKLTVFMTATCEFSRFDNPRKTSAGEMCLLNDKGGAIALFSTTRMVYADQNFALNTSFYNYAFSKDQNGQSNRLGDIMRMAKNASGYGYNKRNFTLLGDPALQIGFPQNKVITQTINGKDASTFKDTIRAFDHVSISGYVADNKSSIISNFNGTVSMTVFDKAIQITTLNNDNNGAYSFETQSNIIYKGKASVINGKFLFNFVVPRDISLTVGFGKISYYAADSLRDATGYDNKLLIGDISKNPIIDVEPPKINLYMNDINFVNGGITNESPSLLAVVSDNSGINTSNTNIGHDITLMLDNDQSMIISLNDAYVADENSYLSGKINYLLNNLNDGKHVLRLKVWDNYNNSTEAELEFVVVNSTSLKIEKVENRPNPFKESTDFFIQQNNAGQSAHVTIKIYGLTGEIVKNIETDFEQTSFNYGPISWNGESENSKKVQRGIYIYVVEILTQDGKYAKKAGKIVVL